MPPGRPVPGSAVRWTTPAGSPVVEGMPVGPSACRHPLVMAACASCDLGRTWATCRCSAQAGGTGSCGGWEAPAQAERPAAPRPRGRRRRLLTLFLAVLNAPRGVGGSAPFRCACALTGGTVQALGRTWGCRPVHRAAARDERSAGPHGHPSGCVRARGPLRPRVGPVSKRKRRSRTQPPRSPRRGDAVLLHVQCDDPRCGVAPGAVTFAPLPVRP